MNTMIFSSIHRKKWRLRSAQKALYHIIVFYDVIRNPCIMMVKSSNAGTSGIIQQRDPQSSKCLLNIVVMGFLASIEYFRKEIPGVSGASRMSLR